MEIGQGMSLESTHLWNPPWWYKWIHSNRIFLVPCQFVLWSSHSHQSLDRNSGEKISHHNHRSRSLHAATPLRLSRLWGCSSSPFWKWTHGVYRGDGRTRKCWVTPIWAYRLWLGFCCIHPLDVVDVSVVTSWATIDVPRHCNVWMKALVFIRKLVEILGVS